MGTTIGHAERNISSLSGASAPPVSLNIKISKESLRREPVLTVRFLLYVIVDAATQVPGQTTMAINRSTIDFRIRMDVEQDGFELLKGKQFAVGAWPPDIA